MKTVNGVPQFDLINDPDYSVADSILTTANRHLREYFSKRKCAGCRYYSRGDAIEVPDSCYILGEIHDDGTYTDPEQFSCAAFEAREGGV